MEEENNDLEVNLNNIAYHLSASNFNIRSYKQQHHNKHSRLGLQSQNKNKKVISKISTEPPQPQSTFNPNSQSRTVTQGLNRSLKYRSTFIEPCPAKKVELRTTKRNNTFFSKTTQRYGTKGTNFSAPHKTETPAGNVNKLQYYEKSWSKGKIKEKYIEGWLNSVCMEFMVNEYFDKNVPNCALKKLGIDENSLLAKGIKQKDVRRLYQSLFVFGMGFYELIGQITNGDMKLANIIWKIYSTVLEYCSRGSLQTSIGQLQKQYAGKVLELTAQLEKKQNIIMKNEELNEKKNNEIFKEIKYLRQENVNLNNEKSVLFDEYNATEQAFNEEVELRLKFEAKINQIYSLHREMGIKHQKLFQQLVTKTEDLKAQSEKYFYVASRISEYREVQIDLKDQLSLFKQKYKRQSACLQQANRQIINLSTKITKLQYDVESIRTLYQEVKLKEKQWQIQRSNMEVIIEMREKSTKQAYKQYQITLEQNNRLNILLSDQRKVMEQYEKDKKNFNARVISIVSQNSYNKRKLEELRKAHETMQDNYNKLLDSKQQIEQKNEAFMKNQECLKVHFDLVQQKINKMHSVNMSQSDQLTQLRNFYKNVDKLIGQKNDLLDNFAKEKAEIKKQLEQFKMQYQQLNSDKTLLQEELSRTKGILEQKQTKLSSIEEAYEDKMLEMATKIQELSQDLDLNKYSLEKVVQQYKNERFQRKALNHIYTQTLRMVQLKDQQEKNLNVKISFLEGDLSSSRNKYLLLERNMMCFIKDFGAIQDQLEEILEDQREQIYTKVEYHHPMVVQDLHGRVCHLTEIRSDLEDEVYRLKDVIAKERVSNKQTLERTNASYKWQITKLKKQSEKLIQAVKNENSYLKDQNTKQKNKLSELQSLAETYRKKIYEKSTSEREEVYKFMIEQKKTQIDNLLAEVDKLQDELVKNKKMLAEVTVSHQRQLFASKDDYIKSIQDSFKKQIAHEYKLKMKEMERNMRQEYSRREQSLREQREVSIQGMSMQDIMKIKNVKPEDLFSQLSQKMGSKYKIVQDRSRQALRKNELYQNRQDVMRRRQLTKLLKNAYQYYDQ